MENEMERAAELAGLRLSKNVAERVNERILSAAERSDNGGALSREGSCPLREDAPSPCLPREELFKSAACVKEGCFSVPEVF